MEKDKAQNKLFVGSIPTEVTEKELREAFSRFGNITDLIIIKDKHSKKSRGFGFVTFKDKKSMKRIIKEKHRIRAKSLEVKLAEPKKASKLQEVADITSITKVFVGGIPKNADSSHLAEYFGKYGEIFEASVIEDKKTNEQRGFGFVNFKNVDSVKRVMDDYFVHNILGKWVECKVALPKSVSDPNTNTEFTIDESSSEPEEENQLKPLLSPEKEVQTIQHLSVPHLIVPSKLPIGPSDLKSLAKIKQKKKADTRDAAMKQPSKLQTSDFGAFVADYEDEEVAHLNKVSHDHHQIESELITNEESRNVKDKLTRKAHTGILAVGQRIQDASQSRQTSFYVRRWREAFVDINGRTSEYGFCRQLQPMIIRASKTSQPSFRLQDGNPLQPKQNIKGPPQQEVKPDQGLYGSNELVQGNMGEELGELFPAEFPGDWQPTSMASAPNSPSLLSKAWNNDLEANFVQPYFQACSSPGWAVEKRKTEVPTTCQQTNYGFYSHIQPDGVVVGDIRPKIDIFPLGPSRICSEYLPPQEEKQFIQGKVFAHSDNLIMIKEQSRDLVQTLHRIPKRKVKANLSGNPIGTKDQCHRRSFIS